MTTVTIDYAYDPLYRLVAADYDSGAFFHYSYDAVGNRLSQETLGGTNTYKYDAANRLIEVDGVPYTWSATGDPSLRSGQVCSTMASAATPTTPPTG